MRGYWIQKKVASGVFWSEELQLEIESDVTRSVSSPHLILWNTTADKMFTLLRERRERVESQPGSSPAFRIP